MSKRDRRRRTRRRVAYVAIVVVIAVILLSAFLLSSNTPHQVKPIILYVNQGNGAVNRSNFVPMLDFASSKGFNTVFFQVYREGVLLFSPVDLAYFVNETHSSGLKIFFALYFTNSSQSIPTSVFELGEDGISLDMSTLDPGTQEGLLASLQSAYRGTTAVTSLEMETPLKPDLLILETYGTSYNQYIKPGVIASVGVFAAPTQAAYQSQFQYALANSDGVMVFDYAGLKNSGY